MSDEGELISTPTFAAASLGRFRLPGVPGRHCHWLGAVRPKRTGLSLAGFQEFSRRVAAIRTARFPGSP